MYLTRTLNFEPKNIILSGSSAGGNLVFILIRYLASIGESQPGVLALSSPWLNMSKDWFPSVKKWSTTDYLSPTIFQPLNRTIMRHYTPQASNTAWFSPVLAGPMGWDFLKKAGTKVYFMRGTRELLADEIAVLNKTLQEAGIDSFCRDVSRHLPKAIKATY